MTESDAASMAWTTPEDASYTSAESARILLESPDLVSLGSGCRSGDQVSLRTTSSSANPEANPSNLAAPVLADPEVENEIEKFGPLRSVPPASTNDGSTSTASSSYGTDQPDIVAIEHGSGSSNPKPKRLLGPGSIISSAQPDECDQMEVDPSQLNTTSSALRGREDGDQPMSITRTDSQAAGDSHVARDTRSSNSNIPKLPVFESASSSQTSSGRGQASGSYESELREKHQSRRYVEYIPKVDGSMKNLKLRPFQTEISQRALRGENDIISLPTGTGKTIVAISVMKQHLEKNPEGKIVFFVPTTALANQQLEKIKLYIQGPYYDQCEKITGEERLSIGALKLKLKDENLKVFVVTPAIVENYLNNSRDASINEFTLLILDECHHAKKKHPYRRLLEACLKSRIDNSEKAIPQLVGLTATVGVGDAKDIWSAEDFMVEMCALFQMTEPPSRVVKEKVSLEFATNNPDEDVVVVEETRSDPVSNSIQTQLMNKVEEFVKEYAPKVLTTDIEFPDGRSSQQYEQYVVTMSREAQEAIPVIKDEDDSSQKKVILGFMYLRLYHRALNLINLLTGSHGLEYLDKELADPSLCSIPELWKPYREMSRRRELLEQVEVEECKYPNVKLKKLVDAIRETLDNKDESRIMIFVKERTVAIFLAEYLNGKFENFKCVFYTSAGPSTTEGGMNPQEQEKALNSFESGSKNIMVATSIAEEGLDIQQCNLTIRYMYVKDMIAKLQTKGRTRASAGKFISIIDHKLCLQDQRNEHKENIMMKALENLQDGSEQFQRRVRESNSTLMIKILQPEVSSPSKIQHGHGTVLCSLCQAELVDVERIKQYMDSHHLVMDGTLHKRVQTYPTPYEQDLMDGIKVNGLLKCKTKDAENGRHCNNQLGQLVKHEGYYLGMFSIKQIVIRAEPGPLPAGSKKYKKWKDVKEKFKIDRMMYEDLLELSQEHCFPVEVLKW